MSKQAMISIITAQLSQMGVPFQVGQGTDLAIANEFVDAGWSTGVKKIVYEASVYFDESAQDVFMWEKTLEIGGGFSGGFDGGSSFQSGTTLYRKVKSIQYGPDGRAYEYTLDLGAIPKAVKEAANQYGWKFKTVLAKAKGGLSGRLSAGRLSAAVPAELSGSAGSRARDAPGGLLRQLRQTAAARSPFL